VKLVGDNTRTETSFDGGVRLKAGGTFFGLLSEHGSASLTRTATNDDGGGSENWAMDPYEMIELGSALKRCGQAALNHRAVNRGEAS
jgi:hypothetical protein